MDLVDYAERVFAAIAEDFTAYAASLGVPEVTADPDLGAAGDNVVEPSRRPWTGTAAPPCWSTWRPSRSATTSRERRPGFPVQYVIRPQTAEHPDYRGYAGQIAAGTFRVGDAVTVLPVGPHHEIAGIDLLGEPVDVAWTPAVGDAAARRRHRHLARRSPGADRRTRPRTSQDVEATVCHVADRPLAVGPAGAAQAHHPHRQGDRQGDPLPARPRRPLPAPGTRRTGGQRHRPRQVLRTAEPLALDPYADSRRTGSFLLIDPADGTTLAAGMTGESPAAAAEDDDAAWDF